MTPSGIVERQNELENLQLLAAQRQLYSEEKDRTRKWYAFSISVTVLFMATSVIPLFKPYEAQLAFSALAVAAGELYFLPHLRQKRITSAMIQEQFDCDVLNLDWNDALPDRPDPKAIEGAVNRFNERKNSTHEWEDLENWYGNPKHGDPTVSTAPIHVARIACQKENIIWDSRQRKKWVLGIKVIAFLLGFILISTWIMLDLSLKQCFSGFSLLLIPLIVAVRDHIARHVEAAKRLDHLTGVVEVLYSDAIREPANIDKINKIAQRTRCLQTEICHHRMEDEPVLDEVYKVLKKYDKMLEKYTS